MYFMYNVLIVFIDLHQNNKTIFLNHTTEYGFQRTLKKKNLTHGIFQIDKKYWLFW